MVSGWRGRRHHLSRKERLMAWELVALVLMAVLVAGIVLTYR
jgi:hypothetical protein